MSVGLSCLFGACAVLFRIKQKGVPNGTPFCLFSFLEVYLELKLVELFRVEF